jgi:predicted RNase H-like HicB family nuclease
MVPRVAEIPALSGRYALLETRESALAELGKVLAIFAGEYRDQGLSFPADSAEILHG